MEDTCTVKLAADRDRWRGIAEKLAGALRAVLAHGAITVVPPKDSMKQRLTRIVEQYRREQPARDKAWDALREYDEAGK